MMMANSWRKMWWRVSRSGIVSEQARSRRPLRRLPAWRKPGRNRSLADDRRGY
jgi:hypothetical protein